jgi:hypothetical protein
MANYPSAPVSFNNRTNLVDTVDAGDVNALYDEVVAIANTVGLNPQQRAVAWATGTFSTAATTWATVDARIQNAENGVREAFTNRVLTSGGSIILPSGTSTVNLTLRAVASQTANLFEARNSSNTVVASVTPAGTLRAVLIDGGSA